MADTVLLTEISEKLNKRSDINLTFTSDKSDFTTKIYTPLNLDLNKWSVGLACLDTYYSFANINTGNSCLKYSNDTGTTWTDIAITVGCYGIMHINEAIKEHVHGFELTPNLITLGSIITISSETLKINFNVNNSIASVLGFDKTKILSSGINKSEDIVKILEINSILVNCDIISNSYLDGITQLLFIHSFQM